MRPDGPAGVPLHCHGGSRKLARFADGAARPAWFSQGSGTDRGRNWAGILPCACSPRWCASQRRNSIRHSTVSFQSGLLFRQGVPPHASYLFKHALVQDAAYGTLLREPRRVLHARIAETLESQFAEIAESQPELLARHYTEAGQIEKAAGLWCKAGQRSLERSALVEAAAQLTRALDQVATLPATPSRRREQIKLQVALITPLLHVKGYAAPETKAAVEQARLLIDQAEALGEAPEDPLLLFSVLSVPGSRALNAFDGDAMGKLATHSCRSQRSSGQPSRSLLGIALWAFPWQWTGDIAKGRAHYDQGIVLYDPAVHRPLATRFGQDARVAILSHRSMALWCLAIPTPRSQTQSKRSRKRATSAKLPTLMFALFFTSLTQFFCGNYRPQRRNTTKLSLWRKKKAPCTGRRLAH